MRSRKPVAVVGALALACSPVVASAATVLFSDNFDAGASAGRYDQFAFDRGTPVPTTPPAPFPDVKADFNFNYGNFTYFRIAPDESTEHLGQPIPLAPRSTPGAPTIGLRLDANDDASATLPNHAVINLYPKLTEYLGGALPGGDHKLTVDVWINYTGRTLGGAGSTEHLSLGMLQQGGGIGGATPVQPPGGPYTGVGWSINLAQLGRALQQLSSKKPGF